MEHSKRYQEFFKHNYRDLAKASGTFTLIQQREHKKPRKEVKPEWWPEYWYLLLAAAIICGVFLAFLYRRRK